MARKAGVHRNYLGMLERGERQPSLEALDALADVLGICAYELLIPPEDTDG